MSLPVFLSDLNRRGIRLSIDGDRLRCHAPAGVLTADVTDELQRRKGEILAFLGAATAVAHQPAIVPLQPHGEKPAVYAVAGHNGDVFTYREMADALGRDQPFFGLQPPGLDEHSVPLDSVETLAAYFADQIAALHRRGPFIIAGYCAGGTIAFELGRQLRERHADVGFLALFGCPYPPAFSWTARLERRARGHVRDFAALPTMADRRRYVVDFARRRIRRPEPPPAVTDPVLLRRAALERTTLSAVLRYRPPRFSGRLALFLPNRLWASDFQAGRWQHAADDVRHYEGTSDCEMQTMLRAPHSANFARHFQAACEV